jgi:hypothetical protein
MPYQQPAASQNRLGTIVDKIALAKPIGKDITEQPKIFATLPGGQLFLIPPWNWTLTAGRMVRAVTHHGSAIRACATRTTARSTQTRCPISCCQGPNSGMQAAA